MQSKEAELQLAVDYLAQAERTMFIYRNQLNKVKAEQTMFIYRNQLNKVKAEQTMTIYRNQFNEVKDEAIANCSTWGLSEKFEQKQVCKIKCHFGE